MPTLYLLRHAHALAEAGAGGSDHERPLSARGSAAAERIGGYLSEIGASPDAALCSSARRAIETWSKLECALGSELLTVTDRLYLASESELLDLVREQPDDLASLIVIAHNPGLYELATGLAGEGVREDYARLRAGLPEGGLCELQFDGEWTGLRPGRARLLRFVVPDPPVGDPRR